MKKKKKRLNFIVDKSRLNLYVFTQYLAIGLYYHTVCLCGVITRCRLPPDQYASSNS